LLANRDYVIATTWGASEPVPGGLSPSALTLDITQFGLNNSARRTVPPDALPTSFLTDLTLYPPTGTSNTDDKGYFTANIQLSDCSFEEVFTLSTPVKTITPPSDSKVRVYGYGFYTKLRFRLSEVGIFATSTLDHTVGLWDTTGSTPKLVWQRQILANEPYYYISNSYRWYNVPYGPILDPAKYYTLALTWGNEPIPARLAEDYFYPLIFGMSYNLNRSKTSGVLPSSLLTDLTPYCPTAYVRADTVAYIGVNFSVSRDLGI